MSTAQLIKGDRFHRRWPAFGIAALLAAATLFGGGGAEGDLNNGIVLGISAVFLFGLVAAHWLGIRPLPNSATVPVLIIAGFLLLGGFQLVPLPSSIWHSQQGRDLPTAALQLVGSAEGWRPLSLDPAATRRVIAAMLLPASMMLAVLGSTRREVQLFLYTILACALVTGTVGALQLALGYPGWLTYYEGGNPGAASGVFANVNHHATLLLAAIVCVGVVVRFKASARAREHRRGRRIDPEWLLIPIFLVVIVATGSRAGLLLVALAVPVAVMIGTGRTSVRLLVAVLLAVGIAVVVLTELAPSGNLVATRQTLLGGENTRYTILPDVWFTLKQFWPAGSGFGTFVQVFAVNENLDFAGTDFVNHAHNDVLELAIEAGLAGLVWLVAGVLAICSRLFLVQVRERQRGGSRLALIQGGFFILALIGLHSLADYPARIQSIAAVAGVAEGLIFFPASEQQPSARRRGIATAVLGAAAAGGLVVGAEVVRIYAAQAEVRAGHGAAAVRQDPTNGAGLALAAEEQLIARHYEAARAFAADAVRHSPLSVRGVRVLAVTDDLEHRSGMAAWRLASSLGWRDPPTQLWAMYQAVANREFATAAIRADALLRTSPSTTAGQIGAIRALAAYGPFRAELIRRLALEPRWATTFFGISGNVSDQELAGVSLTLFDLARSGSHIDSREARPAIQTLINRKQYQAAIGLDQVVSKRSSTELANALAFDRPNEDYVFDVTPFDWNLIDTSGTVSSIEQSGSRRVLVLGTDGRHKTQPVRRYLALPPGAYRLTYAMAGASDSPAALGLAVYCAGSATALANSSTDPLEGSGFAERELRFSVPASCPVVLFAFETKLADGPVEARFADLTLDQI